VTDEIRRWSDELARDPSSLVFLQLGEALRRTGQLPLAHKVALRGLERHPHLSDAHDLLARIAVDRGELQRAFDEWDAVLRLAPGHLGALRGLGYLCYQQGRVADAERYLRLAGNHGDETSAQALEKLRVTSDGRANSKPAVSGNGKRPSGEIAQENAPPGRSSRGVVADQEIFPPSEAPRSTEMGFPAHDPRALFADLLGEQEQTALLLDQHGLVLAGIYVGEDGADVGAEVGAELSGVSDAATRATRHLDIGDWTAIALETEVAIINMMPSVANGLVMLAASRGTPLGSLRRVLERCADRGRRFLERRR
jgi:tetratricopeptide (TPR) repeat protein